MKQISFYLLLFSLGSLFSSCNHDHAAADLDNWTGNYLYEEAPVKANAGYAMVMEWALAIKKQNDTSTGILEINGQQTSMKLLTAVSGDNNSITIIYTNLIEGNDENFKKGDTLFTLSKKAAELITKWNVLEPRLSAVHTKECNCFIAMAAAK